MGCRGGEVGGGGGGGRGGRVAVGKALLAAAAAAVHERLAQRATQEEKQHRRRRATQEQQELPDQTQRWQSQSRKCRHHMVRDVRQGDVADALWQVARDVQDRERHDSGAQPVLSPMLLLLG